MFRTLLPSIRSARLLSTESLASTSLTEEKPLKKIGRALETYIKLSKEHVSMMARERNTSGTQWLSREKLEKKLDEKITEEMVRTICKDTRVSVEVSDAGTGKFDIDGLGLHDFRHLIARFGSSMY
ncbi:hypothetical protein TELCIR_10703 [Teladorsagia circumcincta]|uniref:Uncharacterized protein n=1 Tax=Teladorsagia circumcincta TaxID=45464 RepID=A0A2G9UBB9_TELCI|nr:hypothetical protein TELCIR_10703 [Teladorsagia circumcincta]